jgi:arginine-tRNA-protein transferase
MSSVIPVGIQYSHCGYCKADGETFGMEGMVAFTITPQDYQMLIDSRWRRSGKFIYKPVLRETCCQLQSIRYIEE